MPESFYFRTTKNTAVSIELPQPVDINSCYIFGIHKSGSTLLNKIIKDICYECKLPFVAPAEQFFSQGFLSSDIVDDISPIFFERGFYYLGFRYFWKKKLGVDLKNHKCILVVRDPRDALVSLYYSSKYSHGMPKSGTIKESMQKFRSELQKEEISEYFSRDNIINDFAETHEKYYFNLPRSSTRIYRYEDVIFFKREWVTDMLTFLGLELPSEKVAKIADRHDLIPDKEQPDKFVRQVVPGNYKKHLSRPIIEKLNRRFSYILSWYGYDRVPFFNL